MNFLLKHKVLSGFLAFLLVCGIASPFMDDDTPSSEPAVVQSESVEDTSTEDVDRAESEAGSVQEESSSTQHAPAVSLDSIPAYSGAAYVSVNGNVPFFDSSENTTTAFESYSPMDSLGRCGAALACVGLETMPTEERGSIGQVKPSGWHTVRYNGVVDGNYLYNRCHLIGYQLTAENANERNLITGTRYLNMEGMLPFENMVADYVKETGNHVMYRSTPIFEGNNLVASGVLMEAYSVEDSGAGIMYCVYCYNVQPGVNINYANGDSSLAEGYTASSSATSSSASSTSSAASSAQQQTQASTAEVKEYILNQNTKKFHDPYCRSVKQMNNPVSYSGTRDELIAQGYDPCKNCNP